MGTDIEEQKKAYLTLTRCLDPIKLNVFDEIYDDILKTFTIIFDAEISQNILSLFDNVLNEQSFDNIEDVKDDVEDGLESSIILQEFFDNLRYKNFNMNREIVQNIIADGIKEIV